ncbi:DUF3124 domain-containing protein [Carboxylicivirga mesophila]|uniref:DUF3124 domain-containing protein n=1 Tax=Carboxylicivirga mesophila TaxID=1166478 RepID=A0ABS5KAE0_9BACT|nr:DUF3124 domain-containing protein [Carboxylicivirga mesophila]MBS2211994.1 DUF3124 domain-containing protein [Carboxylicivirga mesophila]
MKHIFQILLVVLTVSACGRQEIDKYPAKQADWKSKQVSIEHFDDFYVGKTYLPVYSHVYHIYDHRTFDLTITASIRNVSVSDSLFLLKADYYNTVGDNIRQYVEAPIYLRPLETLEIVIEEKDIEGGSGANFVFDWAMKNDKNPPLFEAVMISTHGQQGLSFTTRGVQIFE